MSTLNDSSPSLQLNNVTVKASQQVRVLGVHPSSDLSLQTRFQCQRDLLSSSSSTQTYPALARRCSKAVLAAAPKTTIDRLQRVLNAAARVVSDTRKFDHGLTRLIHRELHWLDIPERVTYKLGCIYIHGSCCNRCTTNAPW